MKVEPFGRKSVLQNKILMPNLLWRNVENDHFWISLHVPNSM